MSATFGFAIYFICWWLVWFAALPFAARGRGQDGAELADGEKPVSLWLLAGVTTLIAGVIFAGVYAVVVYRLLPVDKFPF
ncbi:MAG: DUF1467 family protein [Hyphomicrobiales bacterium]|nr:DUF1467 family protein [Hyphomicrobiales bacterium]